MSGPWEKYAAKPAAEAGPWTKYQAAPAAAPAPAREELFAEKLGRGVLNLGAGAIRGAGSIGATLKAPFDYAEQGMERLLGAPARATSINAQRRADMTAALGSLGADTDSLAFGAGKLGGEIAGTLGVGGTLANVAGRALPAAAAPVVDAIATAGMRAGGLAGPAGVAARTAGGAITGGASAALVNPEDAASGALIGGAAPGLLQGAGMLGNAAGRTIRGGEQTPEMVAAIKAARGQGYVIPPTQAKPSLANRILEGFSGKITTAQNASAKNQAITNKIAAEALGLPLDVTITPDLLKSIRSQAGDSYKQISTLGQLTGDARFNNQIAGLKGAYEGAAKDFPGLAKPELSALLDSLRQPTFKASSAVDAVRILREKADEAFASGSKGTAKALRSASAAMEDLIERNLLRINADNALTGILRGGGGTEDIVRAGLSNPAQQMLKEFREARQLIAKTYTVEKALNPSSGSVDARKLAAQLNRGKPLSGGLKDAADFANRFPKASQTVEGMGSLPQTSPLDWIPAGALSMGTGNPLMMAGVLARPAARSAALSGPVQNRLIQGQPNALAQMLASQEAQQFLLRAAPNALSGQ